MQDVSVPGGIYNNISSQSQLGRGGGTGIFMDGGNSTHFAVAQVVEDNEPIDKVLISALEDPRERMVVLNIENTILNFVKSRYEIVYVRRCHVI